MAVLGNPNDLQQWILSAGQNGAELVQCLGVENALSNGITEEVHEFGFTDDQMNAIVAAIAVLTKAQSFPGVTVQREQIALDTR